MKNARLRFRITPWPAVVLPLPPAHPKMRYLLRDRFFFVDLEAEFGPEIEYHEMYLRVVSVDLEDDHEIARFVGRFEPLGMWHGIAAHDGGYLGLGGGVTRESVLERAAGQYLLGEQMSGGNVRYSESLDDFRYGASSLRDLVNAWIWVNEGRAPDKWECPAWDETNPIDGPPKSARDAAHFLAWGVTEALERLYLPYILVTDEDKEPDLTVISSDLPLYCICCLELYNHIIEQVPYKQCANETCGRLFVRQYGRAQHGQHRATGVKYCSVGCARAQAQREHRRRTRLQGI